MFKKKDFILHDTLIFTTDNKEEIDKIIINFIRKGYLVKLSKFDDEDLGLHLYKRRNKK